METNGRSQGPEGVIEAYVAACRRADAEELSALFHPQASMSGFLAGEALHGGPQPFIDAIAGNPPPGADYSATIEDVHSEGGIAWGVLRERNLLGMDFLNHFQLMESGGRWLIVAKLFESS